MCGFLLEPYIRSVVLTAPTVPSRQTLSQSAQKNLVRLTVLSNRRTGWHVRPPPKQISKNWCLGKLKILRHSCVLATPNIDLARLSDNFFRSMPLPMHHSTLHGARSHISGRPLLPGQAKLAGRDWSGRIGGLNLRYHPIEVGSESAGSKVHKGANLGKRQPVG